MCTVYMHALDIWPWLYLPPPLWAVEYKFYCQLLSASDNVLNKMFTILQVSFVGHFALLLIFFWTMPGDGQGDCWQTQTLSFYPEATPIYSTRLSDFASVVLFFNKKSHMKYICKNSQRMGSVNDLTLCNVVSVYFDCLTADWVIVVSLKALSILVV